MNELDKYENASNASASLSSDSNERFLRVHDMHTNFVDKQNLKKSASDIRLPSTR
jgi:hypothetical protein